MVSVLRIATRIWGTQWQRMALVSNALMEIVSIVRLIPMSVSNAAFSTPWVTEPVYVYFYVINRKLSSWYNFGASIKFRYSMLAQWQDHLQHIFSQQLQNKTLPEMRRMRWPNINSTLERLRKILPHRLQKILKYHRLFLLHLQVGSYHRQSVPEHQWMSDQDVLRPLLWQLFELSFWMYQLQRVDMYKLLSWVFLVCVASGYYMQEKESIICLQRPIRVVEWHLSGVRFPELANVPVQNKHPQLQSVSFQGIIQSYSVCRLRIGLLSARKQVPKNMSDRHDCTHEFSLCAERDTKLRNTPSAVKQTVIDLEYLTDRKEQGLWLLHSKQYWICKWSSGVHSLFPENHQQ